jgi:hypothetical protein
MTSADDATAVRMARPSARKVLIEILLAGGDYERASPTKSTVGVSAA